MNFLHVASSYQDAGLHNSLSLLLGTPAEELAFTMQTALGVLPSQNFVVAPLHHVSDRSSTSLVFGFWFWQHLPMSAP